MNIRQNAIQIHSYTFKKFGCLVTVLVVKLNVLFGERFRIPWI